MTVIDTRFCFRENQLIYFPSTRVPVRSNFVIHFLENEAGQNFYKSERTYTNSVHFHTHSYVLFQYFCVKQRRITKLTTLANVHTVLNVLVWELRAMLAFLFILPIFFTFLDDLSMIVYIEDTIYLQYDISFSHARTNKLARVLKLKEVAFLDTQGFYDDGLISKIVILHFPLPLYGKSQPFGLYHRTERLSAGKFVRQIVVTSQVHAYLTELYRRFSGKKSLYQKLSYHISHLLLHRNHPFLACTTIFGTSCIKTRFSRCIVHFIMYLTF